MKYKWAEPTDKFFGANGGNVITVDELSKQLTICIAATRTDSEKELGKLKMILIQEIYLKN